jgi:hypothetical protein
MNGAIDAWVSQASHLIGDCFDQAKPLLDQDYEGLSPQVRFVAAQLFIDCHLSSESALILLKEGKEWDADLVGRAVMEGSMKFAYMLHGSHEEIQEKVREYWDVLPLFSVIRHGEHARSFLAEVPDPEAIEWMPLYEILVEPDAVSAIRSRYSKRDRQIVEERWSFSGICKTFASTGDPGMRLLAGLAHGYSMSSHLVHKDADGVGMVWERYGREPHRRMAVSIAHSARVISDACSFGRLRLLSLLRACHLPEDTLDAINERYAALDEALKAANDHFNKVEYPRDA